MIKTLSNIIWLLLLPVLAAVVPGCSDEPVCPESETVPSPVPPAREGEVFIRFQMNLTGSGIPGGSRAGEYVTGETPGTSRENAINVIDLLVYNADNGSLIDVVTLDESQTAKIIAGEVVVASFSSTEGMKVNVFAAVNMPDRVRMQFSLGSSLNDLSISSVRADYWDVIEDIVPHSAGSQEKLENDGTGFIPMTGQFIYDDGAGKTGTITVVPEKMTKDNPFTLHADVCRMVAKIHVLANTEKHHLSSTNEDVEYVNAKTANYGVAAENGTDPYNNWMGWIRLENVRYMPNGTNKSSYIFPQPVTPVSGITEYSDWKDLNMDLDYYAESGRDQASGMDGFMGFDALKWMTDFSFYSGRALHMENISTHSHMAQVETFSQVRLDNTVSGTETPERYTRGMYCLENYFSAPADFTSFADYIDAIPMVTHVSIAAKLTPRWLVVLDNYVEMMDNFVYMYEHNKTGFWERYELNKGDFTDEDVARWQAIRNNSNYQPFFNDSYYKFRTFRIIKLNTEADATDIINWSLMANKLWSRNPADFENGKYPEGTFYVYDRYYDNIGVADDESGRFVWPQRYLYMTAGVMANATGEDVDLKTYSVPHIGGWGYYYTYLNATGNTPADGGMTPFYDSQVMRNTYYIVNVERFGMPGGAVSRPEYIKVNTEPVGWDYAGTGDINLH